MSIVKSNFLKNVLMLFKGNVVFQITIILTLIFLARHYPPEQIGRYSVYISIISILSTIAPGRLEMALMLPKNEKKAFEIYVTSILLITFVSLLFLIVSIALNLLDLFFLEANGLIVLVSFLGVFFVGLNLLQIQYLNRLERFANVSKGKALTAITIAVFQILSVYFFKSVFGLVLSYFIGFFTSCIYYQFSIRQNITRIQINVQNIKPIIKEYRQFPTLNNLSSLFNIVANQGPVVFIEAVYGSAISGFYSVVQKTLNAPVSLVGSAFSQVFYKKITSDESNSNVREFMKSTTKYFFVLSILIFLFVFLFAETIYVFVFGKEYIISAIMAKLIVYFFLARLIFVSQNALLIAQKRIKLDLGFNVFYVTSIFLPIIVSNCLNLSWETCILMMSISGSFTFLLLGYILFKKAK